MPVLSSSQQVEPSSPQNETGSQDTSQSSQSTNKENAPPTTSDRIEVPSDALPPQIIALLSSITETLTTYFSTYPPHTIQRLSELLLQPKRHYRTLPSYLHAVDRVVHVTSGANVFPLPAALPDSSASAVLTNGDAPAVSGADPSTISWGNSTTTVPSLGSDEALGGALLTPIPWLRNGGPEISQNGSSSQEMEGEIKTESTETVDGPNGAGRIETVTVSVNGIPSTAPPSAGSTIVTVNGDSHNAQLRAEGGITQGELLRQEQKAGIVPAAHLTGRIDDQGNEEEETPHARGPEEIGMEDMGPQAAISTSERVPPGAGMQGIDVEAAVGRRAEHTEDVPERPKRGAEEELSGDSKKIKEDDESEEEPEKDENKDEVMKDEDAKAGKTEEDAKDENMEIVDADGKTKDEAKIGEDGDVSNVGTDAIDSSTV